MAVSDTLHDLLDDQEMLVVMAHEQLLSVYRRINPARLTDPDDDDFDIMLRDAVWDIMREMMTLGHQAGAESAERISGTKQGDKAGSRLLVEARLIKLRLNWLVEDMGRAVDRFVQIGRMTGQSDDTLVDAIVRTLKSTGREPGVSPAGGLRGLSHALAEIRRLFGQAISAASRAGSVEVYGA